MVPKIKRKKNRFIMDNETKNILKILGVAVASLIMAPILQLLHENTP